MVGEDFRPGQQPREPPPAPPSAGARAVSCQLVRCRPRTAGAPPATVPPATDLPSRA